MYTESFGSNNNVPAFLTKLWKLVDSSENDLITWSQTGNSFIIRNQAKFARELLPRYFKHNNMASFIRQLNMYGFRKLTHIENTGLKIDNDEIEFYHQHFLKGQECLLEHIKRKQNSLSVTTAKSNGSLDEKPNKEEVQLILTDVKEIKNKQDSVNNLLINLQSENEALWKEIATLRHKHQKQQQIVERLIHFLLSLVHTGGIGVKRKLPLMIDNNGNKSSTDNASLSNFASNLLNADSGPIIHEITHTLLEDDDEFDQNLNSPIINSALSETSEPVPQFEEPNDDSPTLVSTTPVPQQQQQQNVYPIQQQQQQQQQQSIENTTGNLDGQTYDPLQETINSTINNDQVLDLNAVGGLPIDDNQLDQLSLSNNQIQQNSMPSNLNIILPSTTSNAGSYTSTNSLVPSTSNVLTTPNISMSGNLNREHFDSHLLNVDSDLSSLQEQLLAGNFNIDNDTLMGLFSADDNLQMNKSVPAISDSNVELITTNSPLSTPLSTPKQVMNTQLPETSNTINLNNNFELCDIVGSSDDNLFNQADLLNSGLNQNQQIMNKHLNVPNYDNTNILNTDDLLSTNDELDQLLNQDPIVDDQDLFVKEKKRKRLS